MTQALEKLLRAYTAEADTFMDCNTDADGEWCDHDDHAEYQRMCQIIAEARQELASLRAQLAEADHSHEDETDPDLETVRLEAVSKDDTAS